MEDWKQSDVQTVGGWENSEQLVWETKSLVTFRQILFLSFRRSHIPFTQEKGAI